MNKILFLILSLLSLSVIAANKEYLLEIQVVDERTGAPLENMQVSFGRTAYTNETVYTDSEGKARFTRSEKLKSGFCSIVDTSGAYYSQYRSFDKKELKATTLKIQVALYGAPNYGKLFADLAKRDAAVRAANSAAGIDTTIFDFVSDQCDPGIEAEFAGGALALQCYISENIRYPQDAIEMDIQGKIYLSFIVEQDGTISHVSIARRVHPSLDYEAARVVYNMPKWTPASCNGEPIRLRARLPIAFKLM